MKGKIRLIGMIVVLSMMIVTVASVFADNSFDSCTNVATSAGAVPADLVEQCGSKVSTPSIVNGPSAMGYGNEAVNGFMSENDLSTPEILNNLGPLAGPTGALVAGCDFDNSGTFTELYCIDWDDNLMTFNTTTAARTDIGSGADPGQEWSSLDMDPTTGVMYGTASACGASSGLYTVNLTTGASTLVGNITGATCVVAAGFDNSGQMYAHDIVADSIYAVDKSTGAATLVGLTGIDANFAQGMDFDESTNTCYLYAFNNGAFQAELRTCDTSTGATALVGVLGATTPGGLVDLTGVGIAAGGSGGDPSPEGKTYEVTQTGSQGPADCWTFNADGTFTSSLGLGRWRLKGETATKARWASQVGGSTSGWRVNGVTRDDGRLRATQVLGGTATYSGIENASCGAP